MQTSVNVSQPIESEEPPYVPKQWNSEQLFGSALEVGIRHEGTLYRLRRTKLGKLILTK